MLRKTAEICQSQNVERQQCLCLSVNIQNTSLEVALNKTTERQRLKADPSRLSKDSFSAILILAFLIMQTSLITLLHPGFQGVRWTRDQPMPGPFPAPPPSHGKGPGNEIDLYSSFIALIRWYHSDFNSRRWIYYFKKKENCFDVSCCRN